jgi:FkbM family methyltransferase
MSVHTFTERRPGPYQAQHGEDRWLERHFAGETSGFFVEVGAYDGVVLSNTYFLESIGWRGVLVEPDAEKARACRTNRPKCQVFECAAVASDEVKEVAFYAVEGGEVYSSAGKLDEFQAERLSSWGLKHKKTTVAARTLDSMLTDAKASRVDFVSIDVEGGELDVLRGFDLKRWQPRVVMIEVNRFMRPRGVREIFTRAGYAFLESIEVNEIYAPRAEARRLVPAIDGFRYGRHLAHKLRLRLEARLEARGAGRSPR